MILDNIKNVGYYNFPKELDEVFDFLNNISTKTESRYDLSNGMYVMIQDYNTVCEEEGKLENHKKYVDIQYIVEGVEQIGITFDGKSIEAYNAESDIEFYKGESFFITLNAGDFTLLFPQDLHMPKIGNGGYVKKVVAKIPLEIFN